MLPFEFFLILYLNNWYTLNKSTKFFFFSSIKKTWHQVVWISWAPLRVVLDPFLFLISHFSSSAALAIACGYVATYWVLLLCSPNRKCTDNGKFVCQFFIFLIYLWNFIIKCIYVVDKEWGQARVENNQTNRTSRNKKPTKLSQQQIQDGGLVLFKICGKLFWSALWIFHLPENPEDCIGVCDVHCVDLYVVHCVFEKERTIVLLGVGTRWISKPTCRAKLVLRSHWPLTHSVSHSYQLLYM